MESKFFHTHLKKAILLGFILVMSCTKEKETVTEAGRLIIESKSVELTAETQDFEVVVSHNVEVQVTIPKEVKWITRVETRTMATDTYIFNVEENVTTEKRTARITFTDASNSLSETVEITQNGKEEDEVNIHDENFRNYCLQNFDKNGDGKIMEDEVAEVTELKISSKKIQSLEGIEHFVNLAKLTCGFNQLTSLDLSHNTKLTDLKCQNNQLTSLIINGCTELTSLTCNKNQLTTLDVSGFTKLTYLSCEVNKLDSLDVTKNTELAKLYCNINQLTSLNISQNTKLTDLNCYSNELTSLNVSNCTKLNILNCQNNKLDRLDINSCMVLTKFCCSNNQLTALDLSHNTELLTLDCSTNQLTILDLSQNKALMTLNCYSNLLKSLDVSMTRLSNDVRQGTLDCAPMATLKTLILKKGWKIAGITENRNPDYIPEETEIKFVD